MSQDMVETSEMALKMLERGLPNMTEEEVDKLNEQKQELMRLLDGTESLKEKVEALKNKIDGGIS